jgi:hypothetical protein
MTDTDDLATTEDDLRGRLDRLSTVAAVDPDGWTKLQDRLPGARPSRRRAGRTPLLVAAALLVIAGAVVLTTRDQKDRTTTDSPTTTTERTTTTTTGPEGTATTAPGAPEAPAPAEGPGVTFGVPDGGAGGGGQAPAGSGGAGAPGPGTAVPTTVATPPTTAPVAPPGGSGAPVEFVTAEYTLQGSVTGDPSANVFMSVYRPGWGVASEWNSPAYPGRNCLSGVNARFPFPEAGPHAYSFGVVASDVAGVRIVTASGNSAAAVVGTEALPGLRLWIARRPNEMVDRFEALDSQGGVIATAPATNGFHALTDTC